MIVNKHSIGQAFRNLNTSFNKAFDKAESNWEKTAMLVNSNTAVEDYAWMGTFPSLKEWVDEKTLKSLAAYDYSIKNKAYEATVAVRRDDIEDDNLGIYGPMAQDAGAGARVWPDRLVSELKLKAFTSRCYDKQYFYDTDHPVGEITVSNKLTTPLSNGALALADASYGAARVMIMSLKDEQGDPMGLQPGLLEVPPALETRARMLLENDKLADDTPNPYKGTAALLVNPWLKSDKQWFLHVVNRPLKPYIFQQRKAPVFVDQTNMDNDDVFMRAVFKFGAEARGNAGYGLWQLSVGSDPA